mgnify:CR=1 FL=1
MEKNQNVDILVGKIISSEKLIQEFSKLDSLDQTYNFCQTIHDGYTKEEFALFIDEILSSFIKESSMDISLIKGIKDADIESVSGGAKVDIKRVVAASLASLSFISIPKFNNTHAVGPNNVDNVAIVQQHQEQEESGTFSRIWSGVKAKLSSLKDIIVRNKGKVTIGALILAAISVCVYKRNDIADGWNNLEFVRHRRFEQNILRQNQADLQAIHAHINNGQPLPQNILDRMNAQHTTIEQEEARLRSSNSIWQSIPGLAQLAMVGTGVKTIWDVFNKGMGSVGALSKSISDFNNARYSINSIAQDVQYQIDLASEKSNKQEFDRKEAGERLEAGLATVRGQERAKKGVRGFFNSVTMEKERLKFIDKKDSHAHAIVFNGASGTGKSFTADHLASAISNATPYVMSSSEVDVNSSKSSIVGQLFGDNGNGYGGYYGYGGAQQEKKNFVKYIEDHPNDGVVIINEYDKMCLRDSNDHPLDETMRAFLDEGKTTINGKTIDCSGIVFILTTNESDGSLQGKVYVDPVTKQLVDPSVDDSTGSRTIVKHDKSFLNRLTIVNFDNLSAQEYNQIARDHISPIIEWFKTDLWGNIDISISDESYDRIAAYVERINEGARTIDKDILEAFSTSVSDKITEMQNNGEEYIGKKFEAVYNDKNNEFTIN